MSDLTITGRTMTTAWTSTTTNDGGTIQAVLTTDHFPIRKQLISSLHTRTLTPDGRAVPSDDLGIGWGPTVGQEATPRWDAPKALEFHCRMARQVGHWLADQSPVALGALAVAGFTAPTGPAGEALAGLIGQEQDRTAPDPTR